MGAALAGVIFGCLHRFLAPEVSASPGVLKKKLKFSMIKRYSTHYIEIANKYLHFTMLTIAYRSQLGIYSYCDGKSLI